MSSQFENRSIIGATSQDVPLKPSMYLQVCRSGLAFAGLAAILLAITGSIDVTGGGASRVFVPLSIGLALILSGFALGSRWQTATFWFSLAMVGQVFSLQLINAGYQLRYQHYKQLDELLVYPNVLFSVGLAVQLIAVCIGLRQAIAGIVNWTRANARTWQIGLLVLCFFLPTTTVSPEPMTYVVEFAIAGFIQLLCLATFFLFARAIPQDALEQVRGIISSITKNTVSDKNRLTYGLALGAAIFVVVLAVALNLFSYERHPHVPDEVAYLMQARFFASGVVALPAPTVPEAFDVYLMKVEGAQWYPVTPPGWAMLLAVGALIGAPFLVNPILGGLNILLGYWLIAKLYPVSHAKQFIVLLAASPWFVFLAMSFMTHMAALTCLLVAAIGVVKARETEKWKWGLLSGLAIGFISLIRPLEAVAVAGLVGLWMIGLAGKRLRISSIVAAAVGTLLFGALGLAFNAKLSGQPLQFPINVYTNELFGPNSNAYGFGPDRGMGWQLDPYPGHGPIDALVNTNLNVSALNTELLGWPIGSFLLIGAFLCFGRLRRSDYLMLAVIAVIYVLHFFYYFSGGPDFGARYWFLMIVPLVVLSVRGIDALASKLKEHEPTADARLYTTIGALVVLTLAVFIPWRAVDKYHNFRGMMPDVRELTAEFNFGRSLVLIRGNKHPDYDSAFIYNSLDLSSDAPVFAWDKDPDTREKLLRAYADRPVWIINSPSLTGGGYKIAAGPMTAASLNQTVE